MKLKTAIQLLESLPEELRFVKAQQIGDDSDCLSVTLEVHISHTPSPTAQEISELLKKLGDVEVGQVSQAGDFFQVQIYVGDDGERRREPR